MVDECLTAGLQDVCAYEVISEERKTNMTSANRLYWLIDPIDGTMNYISGSPDFALSVALVDYRLTAFLGLVFIPRHNELYSAVRGNGAFRNHLPIHTKKATLPIVSYGISEDSRSKARRVAEMLEAFVSAEFHLRQSGSAAIDICRVATGMWSGFIEDGLFSWDVAAANLVATESGAISKIQRLEESNKLNYLCGNDHGIASFMAKFLGA
jgi:myo-inositol-1(or 4)-monophosphatase